METGPDWGKHGTIATYVGIAVAIVLVLGQEIWPPDPAHPMAFDFLSKSLLVPPWLAVLALVVVTALTAAIVGRMMKRRIQAPMLISSPNNLSKVFDIHPTCLDDRVLSPQPKIQYTAKMRVSFENKSNDHVRVLAPRWLTDVEAISVQCGAPPFPGLPYSPGMLSFGYRYQLEEYKGSWKLDRWKRKPNGDHDEYPELRVDPGWTFRIWIGLNPCVPHNDLESRRKTSRLGTLILPLEINGQTREWACSV